MGGNSMRDIKRRVRSVTNIEHITNAMKLVSASKLRRSKVTFEKTGEYFHFVTESIEDIFNNNSDIPVKYLAGEGERKNKLYVIITSNRGLCGSFNSNVIRRAETEIKANPYPTRIVAVGSKGRDYFRKRDYDICYEYLEQPEKIAFIETHAISAPVIEKFEQGEIDEVIMVYTSFISTMEQRVRQVRLLPFEIKRDKEILPMEKQVDYDPSVEEVFNYLVPKYVEIMIYNAIVESAVCEHAARRMAMESATDNANGMIADLTLYYNRARQAAITSEITEIVSGADALK
ncbi:ATP synthase gamma chain [Clostridia bacterium]|nr:ATP synthase gamma chain [Clostridia bacterium]